MIVHDWDLSQWHRVTISEAAHAFMFGLDVFLGPLPAGEVAPKDYEGDLDLRWCAYMTWPDIVRLADYLRFVTEG